MRCSVARCPRARHAKGFALPTVDVACGSAAWVRPEPALTGPCALGGSPAVLDARRVPGTVPVRTQHPPGAVVNRPSVWSDR
jgi:hypothetical protein